MSINSIIKKIPPYACDIKTNLANIFSADLQGLTKEQVYGIALTACFCIKHELLLNNIRAEAKIFLEDSHFDAAKTAVIIMSLTNAYYSYVYALEDKTLRTHSSGLEMSMLLNHNIDQTDFEMYILTASIINKCDYCINVHSNKLIKKGLDMAALNNIGRIASVLKATADVLDLEAVRNYDLTPRGENI